MGLRQSIDEGAGEIGADIAEELPESADQLRAAVPDDVATLQSNGSEIGDDSLTVERVVSETPIDRFL
jgi:hypothetical protein